MVTDDDEVELVKLELGDTLERLLRGGISINVVMGAAGALLTETMVRHWDPRVPPIWFARMALMSGQMVIEQQQGGADGRQ